MSGAIRRKPEPHRACVHCGTRPTAELVRQQVSYDVETGKFHRLKGVRGHAAGSEAGSIRPDGYVVMQILGFSDYGHRFAWLVMTGEWPVHDIDHEDLDPSNNSWRNLRAATHSQNHANKARPNNNTSGFKGVVRVASTGRWGAQIKHQGRRLWLGTFDKPEQAHEAYMKRALLLFGEFSRSG